MLRRLSHVAGEQVVWIFRFGRSEVVHCRPNSYVDCLCYSEYVFCESICCNSHGHWVVVMLAIRLCRMLMILGQNNRSNVLYSRKSDMVSCGFLHIGQWPCMMEAFQCETQLMPCGARIVAFHPKTPYPNISHNHITNPDFEDVPEH